MFENCFKQCERSVKEIYIIRYLNVFYKFLNVINKRSTKKKSHFSKVYVNKTKLKLNTV